MLTITSEWPTEANPEWVPFIVRQVQSLRNAGLSLDVFAFRGAKNPANYLRAWIDLRRSHQFDEYDLVHAHFGQSGLLALPRRIPLVVTYYGSDLLGIFAAKGRYSLAGGVLRSASQQVARHANANIAVSSGLLKHLPTGVPAAVIPMGVDMNLFRPLPMPAARTRLGLPLDQNLVLFAGQPQNPVKRFALAQSAMGLLDRHLQAELIAAIGVRHEQMPLYFNACDALLLTSRHEGSPSVIKEALACNTPIVSVDVGDVRERIGSVEGCAVCVDDNPQTIAQALAKVLRRGQRIEGRAAVRDLDEPCIADRIIHVYHQALGPARRVA